MANGLRPVAGAARSGRRGRRRLDAPERAADRSACGCRSAWWRSSTRTDPTSPATPSASASSPATPRSSAARRARSARTSPSRPCSARAWPRPGCPHDSARARGGHPPRGRGRVHAAARARSTCLIPRGGPSLIRSILDNATVPYVIDGDGNCHVYVDASADLGMARADRRERQDAAPVGVQRRRDAARPPQHRRHAAQPTWRRGSRASSWSATSATREILGDRSRALATDDDYATEFLDLKLAVRVVDTLDAAIAHITRYGTGHSEAIVTNDLAGRRPLRARGRRGRRARERVHPVRRRRGARLRRRDRHLHPEAPRPRARWACASSPR